MAHLGAHLSFTKHLWSCLAMSAKGAWDLNKESLAECNNRQGWEGGEYDTSSYSWKEYWALSDLRTNDYVCLSSWRGDSFNLEAACYLTKLKLFSVLWSASTKDNDPILDWLFTPFFSKGGQVDMLSRNVNRSVFFMNSSKLSQCLVAWHINLWDSLQLFLLVLLPSVCFSLLRKDLLQKKNTESAPRVK